MKTKNYGKWINVKKAVPKNGKIVVCFKLPVTQSGNCRIKFCCYDHKFGEWVDNDGGYSGRYFYNYWLPIPPLPKRRKRK